MRQIERIGDRLRDRIDLQHEILLCRRGRAWYGCLRDVEIELLGPRTVLALLDPAGGVRGTAVAIHNDVPQDLIVIG